MAPRIRFVRGPRGHRLATAVDGEGPYLVLPAWWVSHVERDLANPRFKAFFQTLAGSFTVVRYDRAGVGLSDRERTEFTLEDEVGDLEAVVDGLGIERASLFAISCGAPPAIALAMRRPALVERLIFFGGYLHGADIGRPSVQQALVALVRASWGLGSRALCDIFMPGADADEARGFDEDQRHGASAETSARLLELTYAMDVRDLVAGVRAPALVIHRRDDRAIGFELGRQLAASLPGAELVALEGREHLPWAGDSDAVLRALGLGPIGLPRDDADAELRRDGDVWTVHFGGRTVHAKHARGLADLALLVASPGRRFAATELMSPTPAGGADPVLDEDARAQYRDRLEEIEEELGVVAAAARPERAERLEAERESILGQLKAATGLGGRRRGLGDGGERARKAVTGRIRESILRLRKLHPELGAHLEAAIETGSTCVYAPATPVRWRT